MTDTYRIAVVGLIWGLSFVLMDALQYVYLGGLFQDLSSYLFGFLVFGVSSLGFILWAWFKTPEQLQAAWDDRRSLLGLNLSAALGLIAFMISVQMIEPAVAYTVGAGVMPLTAWAIYKLGLPEGEPIRNRFEGLGNLLIFNGILFLTAITIAGFSGFVRGDVWAAVTGVSLAIIDGILLTVMLIYCQRLDRVGVGATAVFGLRVPLYVLVAGGAVIVGVEETTRELDAQSLLMILVLGLAVTVPPLYALQKAVAAVSTMTISILTALGPFLVFLLQVYEGRVDYSTVTLVGLFIYFTGAVLAAFGAIRGSMARG
jgi:drug/metabolite transporter (DMT)-like permease